MIVQCLLVLAAALSANAGNILLVFPVPSPSHAIFGNELAKAIVKKGHHVTMITAFPIKEDLQNYTEIVVTELAEFREKYMKPLMQFNTTFGQQIKGIKETALLINVIMDNVEVQRLLKSNQRFDLVIQELMICEAFLGLGYFYNAPTIVVNTMGSMPPIDNMVGNSRPLAYVPTQFHSFVDEMSFFERLGNTISTVFLTMMYVFLIHPIQDEVMHQYFPSAPSLDELAHNVSLVFLNAHFSVVETPRPYMPNMIPVGGLHVQPQTLPKDLERYLDGAKDGAILFSLGSNFKSADLPKEKLDAILNTFAKFPQKILWKFEDDTLNVSSNVKISKWVPQRAVLDHPNVRAFITHGGLLSITEAVYYGVPFIGVPVFADQHYNLAIAVHKRMGITFDIDELTEETFTSAIKEILENPIYRENIAIRSSLLREQPVQPLDLAVYWIEHVLKYKGASHLQSAGVKLHWIQSYLLDVIAFLVAIASIFTYMSYVITRKCFRFLCGKLFLQKKLKVT